MEHFFISDDQITEYLTGALVLSQLIWKLTKFLHLSNVIKTKLVARMINFENILELVWGLRIFEKINLFKRIAWTALTRKAGLGGWSQ